MIKIITLISVACCFLIAGCSDNGLQDQQTWPDTSLSGDPDEGVADDPLKQLQDEGKLPEYGTGSEGKAPVLPSGSEVLAGSGPEVTSLYLPSVDPDQDNVPNVVIPGYPEIELDNCAIFNPGQEDINNNGIGDTCENL